MSPDSPPPWPGPVTLARLSPRPSLRDPKSRNPHACNPGHPLRHQDTLSEHLLCARHPARRREGRAQGRAVSWSPVSRAVGALSRWDPYSFAWGSRARWVPPPAWVTSGDTDRGGRLEFAPSSLLSLVPRQVQPEPRWGRVSLDAQGSLRIPLMPPGVAQDIAPSVSRPLGSWSQQAEPESCRFGPYVS